MVTVYVSAEIANMLQAEREFAGWSREICWLVGNN